MRLREVRQVPPIASGYVTDRVYRLRREETTGVLGWTLEEERLSHNLVKQYDSGRPNEWLATYSDAGTPEELRFVCAFRDGRAEGLLTWRALEWNGSLWLVDIRVREAGRRSGVGSALVRFLQAMARESNARGIFLETQITNFPAVRFYRKHGFDIAGFNDHLYSNHDIARQEVALFLFWERT